MVFSILFSARYLGDLISVFVALLAQGGAVLWILRGPAAGAARSIRRCILLLGGLSAGVVVLALLLRFASVARYFPTWVAGWGRPMALAWALLSLLMLLALGISRLLPRISAANSAGRRGFLRTAEAAILGAPVAAMGYGMFVERLQLTLREERIVIPDLPADLDGLRIVQVTDIHLSPFLSERDLERAVAMANETRPHVAVVTGDLITSEADPLDACLDRLARLKADSGILGCLGNHEVYAGAEDYTAQRGARLGIRFLRTTAEQLRFGQSLLNIAGVDYQRMHSRYLAGADRLVRPDAFNLLLSHNPDVFPVAASQGYRLTLAGHTHGGQVRVEILRQDLNIARFYTPYVDGLYRDGSSSIFVSRGIGTIAIPARLGSTPEVALLHLCRS